MDPVRRLFRGLRRLLFPSRKGRASVLLGAPLALAPLGANGEPDRSLEAILWTDVRDRFPGLEPLSLETLGLADGLLTLRLTGWEGGDRAPEWVEVILEAGSRAPGWRVLRHRTRSRVPLAPGTLRDADVRAAVTPVPAVPVLDEATSQRWWSRPVDEVRTLLGGATAEAIRALDTAYREQDGSRLPAPLSPDLRAREAFHLSRYSIEGRRRIRRIGALACQPVGASAGASGPRAVLVVRVEAADATLESGQPVPEVLDVPNRISYEWWTWELGPDGPVAVDRLAPAFHPVYQAPAATAVRVHTPGTEALREIEDAQAYRLATRSQGAALDLLVAASLEGTPASPGSTLGIHLPPGVTRRMLEAHPLDIRSLAGPALDAASSPPARLRMRIERMFRELALARCRDPGAAARLGSLSACLEPSLVEALSDATGPLKGGTDALLVTAAAPTRVRIRSTWTEGAEVWVECLVDGIVEELDPSGRARLLGVRDRLLLAGPGEEPPRLRWIQRDREAPLDAEVFWRDPGRATVPDLPGTSPAEADDLVELHRRVLEALALGRPAELGTRLSWSMAEAAELASRRSRALCHRVELGAAGKVSVRELSRRVEAGIETLRVGFSGPLAYTVRDAAGEPRHGSLVAGTPRYEEWVLERSLCRSEWRIVELPY